MEFSLRRVGDENIHLFDSGVESDIQIVFTPGGLNPEVWKHQLKYFSKVLRTVAFRPTVSRRDREGEKEALKQVLEMDGMENVVLVSNVFGNSISQEFEGHENVISTVLTGGRGKMKKIPPRRFYNALWAVGTREPKIAKKFFFSDLTDYQIVKNFVDDIEKPAFEDMKTFYRDISVRPPNVKSMFVFAEKDGFSDREHIRKIRNGFSISVLKEAGTFSFYEKPQEYNKALSDFLSTLDELVERKTVKNAKKTNRSLMEFQETDKDVERPRKMKVVQ